MAGAPRQINGGCSKRAPTTQGKAASCNMQVEHIMNLCTERYKHASPTQGCGPPMKGGRAPRCKQHRRCPRDQTDVYARDTHHAPTQQPHTPNPTRHTTQNNNEQKGPLLGTKRPQSRSAQDGKNVSNIPFALHTSLNVCLFSQENVYVFKGSC